MECHLAALNTAGPLTSAHAGLDGGYPRAGRWGPQASSWAAARPPTRISSSFVESDFKFLKRALAA